MEERTYVLQLNVQDPDYPTDEDSAAWLQGKQIKHTGYLKINMTPPPSGEIADNPDVRPILWFNHYHGEWMYYLKSAVACSDIEGLFSHGWVPWDSNVTKEQFLAAYKARGPERDRLKAEYEAELAVTWKRWTEKLWKAAYWCMGLAGVGALVKLAYWYVHIPQ